MALLETSEIPGSHEIELGRVGPQQLGVSQVDVGGHLSHGTEGGDDVPRETAADLRFRRYSPRTTTFRWGSSPSEKLEAPSISDTASWTIFRS